LDRIKQLGITDEIILINDAQKQETSVKIGLNSNWPEFGCNLIVSQE